MILTILSYIYFKCEVPHHQYMLQVLDSIQLVKRKLSLPNKLLWMTQQPSVDVADAEV